ncbi:MAG: hypothetical protein A3J74_06705 [Elusimicrobia bacterium RIFCSPHIGHO2_02_FULL_57_9]|nr:MAG: hypothetical protein A3J74_06705 [Elusimicrobia bacterium RIFCSPHIGHO2_02_FULL_57_9]
MDFSLSESQKTLLKEFRKWLRYEFRAFRLKEFWDHPNPRKRWEAQHFWHRRLFESRWIGLHWPCEYGGRGAGVIEEFLVLEELARRGISPGVNEIAIAMIGPLFLRHGTAGQKAAYLGKILSAEEIWCQGFSEPQAGSDLAALSTRAQENSESFLINGRKAWTSFAHRADRCLLMARTDAGVDRKEAGLSLFIVDMHAPGIEVRPIAQIDGEAEFCEITLDSVSVPKDQVLGPVNRGWGLALEAAGYERLSVQALYPIFRGFQELRGLLRLLPWVDGKLSKNPIFRQKFAQLAIETQALRCTALRVLAKAGPGLPNAESSLVRLFSKELEGRMAVFALEAIAASGEQSFRQGKVDWLKRFLTSRGVTIARGTSQMHRNLIARLLLGLPA